MDVPGNIFGQWMQDLGVDWVNIQCLDDWEKSNPGQSIDMNFCGTALYCHDEKEASMAMEVDFKVVAEETFPFQVEECASARDIWSGAGTSLVLSQRENSWHCCQISAGALQTPQGRDIVNKMEATKSLYTGKMRYMVRTSALEKMEVRSRLST